jgi:hypothetical protein
MTTDRLCHGRKTTISEAVSVDGLFILKAQVQCRYWHKTDIRLTPAGGKADITRTRRQVR